MRETERELWAKEAKVKQARKKIVDEDLGGISMDEFQGVNSIDKLDLGQFFGGPFLKQFLST